MKIKPWIKMILVILAIAVFVKWTPLVLNESDAYRKITEKSIELGIDNAALFYTEESHSSIAEQNMKVLLGQKVSR